jgi:peptidoglycan/LPS O-acetylase OafA/YrhL
VAVVLLDVVWEPTSALGRGLALAPLVWVGKISYGLYLWHVPIFLAPLPANLAGWLPSMGLERPLVHLAARLAVVFAVTSLSYHVVEVSCLRLKHRLRAV